MVSKYASRLKFHQSRFANVPLQLLPKRIHAADTVEKLLAWQEEEAKNFTLQPEFFILCPRESETSLPDEKLLIDSLEIQSYRNFRHTSLEPDSSFSNRLVDILSENQQDRSLYYFILLSPGSFLHPSALFILAKYIQRRSFDFGYSNETLLTEDLTWTEEFLRRAPLKYPDNLCASPVGEFVVVKESFLRKFLEGRNPSNVAEFAWLLALEALSLRAQSTFIPLALHHRIRRGHTLSRETTFIDQLQQHGTQFGNMLPATPNRFRLLPQDVALDIDIILPFRNNESATIEALLSIAQQNIFHECHIYLIDNGSTVESRQKLESFLKTETFPHLTYIESPGHFHYARINNQAVSHGKNPLILFMNNDVALLQSETLQELRRWITLPHIGIVGGALYYEDNSLQHGGIEFLGFGPANITSTNHPTDTVRKVDAVSFALALTKRDLFQSVGGLDELLCPNGFGDALFGRKIQKLGFNVLYTPYAKARHSESKTRQTLPEELELLELFESGVPIPDLNSDFSPTSHPHRLLFSQEKERPDRELVLLSREFEKFPLLERITAFALRSLLFLARRLRFGSISLWKNA